MFIRRIHLLGLLVVVFIGGAIAGTVFDSLANGAVEKKKRVHISDLAQQVNLSAEQKQQMEAILEGSRNRVVKISQSIRPEIHTVWRETRDQIKGIMTPEQLAKFDKLLEQYDKQRKDRESQRQDSKPDK